MLKTLVNHQIKAATVRVVNEQGEQIGVMSLSQALTLAQEHGLDVVEVSPNAQPPVVKLIDFAKFKYQQKKLEQQQKKNAKKTEVKTIWISMRISEHDMEIKANKISEFLAEGDLVKIELRMRGREQAYGDLGRQNLEKFLKFITHPYKIEVPMKRMGGTFSLTVVPSK
jgi:translation initiation factor IF-3